MVPNFVKTIGYLELLMLCCTIFILLLLSPLKNISLSSFFKNFVMHVGTFSSLFYSPCKRLQSGLLWVIVALFTHTMLSDS